jgi:crotonobetainyl-CoA:carnitine CoA-transferase CaiB-like acyl-CoA transferase
MADQALAGTRVLDLTYHIAGPYCTKMLADFGADVIKVEPPGTGDVTRRLGPFPNDEPDPEASGLFLYLNTNKKSVTLDIDSETGRNILRRLVADADVLVESFPPGALASLGYSYEAVSAENPRLVMVSISPFGQDGPWRDWKADEVNLHAISGLMGITGSPEREPLKTGGHQALFNTGINAFTGTLMAIYGQIAHGMGQYVDVSAYESMSYMIEPPRVVQASTQGTFTNRVGNTGTLYPASNGHVNLIRGGAGNTYEVLAKVTGEDAFLGETFKNIPAQGAASPEVREALEALLIPWLLEHTKEEFYHAGQAGGQNFGYVANPRELTESPHLKEGGTGPAPGRAQRRNIQGKARLLLSRDGRTDPRWCDLTAALALSAASK